MSVVISASWAAMFGILKSEAVSDNDSGRIVIVLERPYDFLRRALANVLEEQSGIENITLANGSVGISVETTDSITIKNVIIANTTTGLQCTVNATITLDNTVIDNNTTGVNCSNLSDITATNTITGP